MHWVMCLPAALALSWLAPATAAAATQLGQLAPSPTNCPGDTNNVQVSVNSGTTYEVPSAGVITSWSHQARMTPSSGRLQVWRPAAGTSFTLVGRSELTTFVAGVVNQFAIRIPVIPGDLLGFRVGPGATGAACEFPGGAGVGITGSDAPGSSDPAPGETRNLPTSPNLLNVAALLEPDCDSDGFGDETQDVAVDCIPPETRITKQPKDKTRKRKATFEFTSNEPGSTFQCLLDGKQEFKACTSPLTVKVKKGKHSFEVTATDSAGNADLSPATASWKVKKKKKKRR